MSRNVVLICLDSVRKDYFNQYATRLRDLSDCSFEQCRAASCWSVPSHASLFTGELAHSHGIHSYNREFAQLDGQDTITERLDSHVSLGVSANTYASPSFGFDSIFDKFANLSDKKPLFLDGLNPREFASKLDFFHTAFRRSNTLSSFCNGAYYKASNFASGLPFPSISDTGAGNVSDRGFGLIEASDEPFFYFANYMDAHIPLIPSLKYDSSIVEAPFWWTSDEFDHSIWDVNEDGEIDHRELEWFTSVYAGAINYLDRQVTEFITRVSESTEKETTFIITADHGENLYTHDDGLIGHTSSLTEGVLHVPFEIINSPDILSGSSKKLFSHLDVPKLISCIVDNELYTEWTAPAAEVVGTGTLIGIDERSNPDYWNRTLRCAYDGSEKFVWSSLDEREKYEISPDRPNRQERIATDVTIPADMLNRFAVDIIDYKKQFEQEGFRMDDLATDTEQQLEDLGYL